MTRTGPIPDNPPADALLAVTATSLEPCDLPEREVMLVRIAALAAVGAPPLSYAVNVGAASSTGLTVEDAQAILLAVALILGTVRASAAAANITEGLGLILAAAEADLENKS